MEESKYLWRFYWDCGRSGSLEGLFVATEKDVEETVGKEAYFGEVLGKHSEVYGTIGERDIRKVDVSSEAVVEVSKHLGDTWSGWNPMDYVQYPCDECGDTMNMEDLSDYTKEDGSMINICWSCKEDLKKEGEAE